MNDLIDTLSENFGVDGRLILAVGLLFGLAFGVITLDIFLPDVNLIAEIWNGAILLFTPFYEFGKALFSAAVDAVLPLQFGS